MNVGDPRLPERFWAKVVVAENGCWLWTAYVGSHGYGVFSLAGKPLLAHRVAYELLVGPIPAGLVLDHEKCDTPACVNPLHLVPKTHAENVRRGDFPNSRKTHCPYGHPYDRANTHISPDGRRYCRACWKRREVERGRRNARAANS